MTSRTKAKTTTKTKAATATKAATKITTREERDELLQRLWSAHVRKLVEKIENTPSSEIDSSTFNAAAKMLAENGVTADTLTKDSGHAGKGLAAEARELLGDDYLPSSSLSAALATPMPPPKHPEETLSALKRLEEN
jgi:hypothetical protein